MVEKDKFKVNKCMLQKLSWKNFIEKRKLIILNVESNSIENNIN